MNLYRYISLDRFFSSLKLTNGEWRFIIRFNSPINFEDKWEGLGNGLVNQLNTINIEREYENRVLSDGFIIEGKEQLRESLNQICGIKDSLDKKLVEAIEYSNEHLMLCWFRGSNNSPDSESFAMWNLYAKNNGILIGYPLQEIVDSFSKMSLKILNNELTYINFLTNHFDPKLHCNLQSLFFKDKSYKYENEYRFIINEKSSVNFKDIELPLPKELIANPSFSDGTILALNRTIREYCNLSLKKSKLSTKFSRNEILDYLK
jgi:hypothetical protein